MKNRAMDRAGRGWGWASGGAGEQKLLAVGIAINAPVFCSRQTGQTPHTVALLSSLRFGYFTSPRSFSLLRIIGWQTRVISLAINYKLMTCTGVAVCCTIVFVCLILLQHHCFYFFHSLVRHSAPFFPAGSTAARDAYRPSPFLLLVLYYPVASSYCKIYCAFYDIFT